MIPQENKYKFVYLFEKKVWITHNMYCKKIFYPKINMTTITYILDKIAEFTIHNLKLSTYQTILTNILYFCNKNFLTNA